MDFDQDNLKLQLDDLNKKLEVQANKLCNLQNQMNIINKEISALTHMKETLTKRLKTPDTITVSFNVQKKEEDDVNVSTPTEKRARGRPKKIVV
jgi:prefoldin subunit 5